MQKAAVKYCGTFSTKFRLNLASNFDIKNGKVQTPTRFRVFSNSIGFVRGACEVAVLLKYYT